MTTDGLRNIRQETIENARCEYELKLVAAPHQGEVPKAMDVKKSKTGSLPK